MIKFLKGLFQGGASTKQSAVPAAEHAGFSISPCPRHLAGGWSTEAVIHKVINDETKQHAFIRADTSPTQEAAIALIISKAKTLIDQQGEKIFS